MSFKQYLAESEKTYKYRLKFAVPLDKTSLQQIEAYFKRVNVLSVSAPSKTILQKNPLDFGPAIQNVEVTIIDVVTGLPLSPFIAAKELASMLKVPEGYVLARGEFDALEVQIDVAQQQADIDQQADKKSLGASALLGTDSVYPEAEQTAGASNYYGDSYNSRFLEYLGTIAAERREAQKVDSVAPLFTWLQLSKEGQTPDDNQAFNADLIKAKVEKQDKDAMVPSRAGEFTDTGKTVKKTYQTAAGKTKTLAGKTTAPKE